MPIVRKIINLRSSRAVCLPKSWIEYIEKQHGTEISEVAMEVDKVLIIKPILPKKEIAINE